MRKKFLAGAAILALLMNSPQASADDDIVIFGGEFEDEATPPPKVKKTEPVKELPTPKEKPAPPKPKVVEPQDKPPAQPQQVEPEPQKPEANPQPVEPEPQKPEIVEPQDKPPVQPQQVENEPTEPVEPLSPEIDQPFTPPTKISGGQEQVNEPVIIVPPTPAQVEQVEPSTPRRKSTSQATQPQKSLKTLKPRFVKLAVDDTYTYYLDKTSVQWKKMPYSSSEYIADVWIRMIEREPRSLDDDMNSYGADNYHAEISLAREQGYQYTPEDLKVLRSQSYVLEHYYLRPKTNQIQFLCELEVFGRPQNAVSERAYDYKNWENLVPGSVESMIYETVIKNIGKSKASERGHMTFVDMLEEYGRFSLR